MQRLPLYAAVLFALCLYSIPAAAATQLLINGSFETGDYTGWSTSGNIFMSPGTQPGAQPQPASDGIHFTDFNGGNFTPNATLSQIFGTVAGQTYTLSFDYGNWGNGSPVTQRVHVTLTGNALLDGRDITDTTISSSQIGSQVYTHFSYTFLADSALTTLLFKDTALGTNASDGLLDNIVVSGPAPVGPGPGGASVPLPRGGFAALGLFPFLLLAKIRRRAHTIG